MRVRRRRNAQTVVDWLAAFGILGALLVAVIIMTGIDWATLKAWLM